MNSLAKLLCVPITETSVESCFSAIQEAEKLADIIELRLDYFPAEILPRVISELQTRLPRLSKPLIVTFRPREQGGKRELSLEDRQLFWHSLPREIIHAIAFADFELDLAESLN